MEYPVPHAPPPSTLNASFLGIHVLNARPLEEVAVLAAAVIEEKAGPIAETSPLGCRYSRERQFPNTYVQPDSYLERWEKERRDTLKFSRPTVLNTFPLSGNRGLYGFTFRDGRVNLREDLIWRQDEEKYNTDFHESGHTPDELETRYWAELRTAELFPRDEKYRRRREYKR